MRPFPRRRYRRLRDLIEDMHSLMARRDETRTLMHGETLDPAFRERLMLAVTQVNRCRYCSYVHAREALTAGIPQDELAALAEGEFGGSPSEQRPALFYAEHFAENDGNPDPKAWSRLVEIYGDETAHAIDLALRVIRIGNLMGNTFDYILYRLSLGHWGLGRRKTVSDT